MSAGVTRQVALGGNQMSHKYCFHCIWEIRTWPYIEIEVKRKYSYAHFQILKRARLYAITPLQPLSMLHLHGNCELLSHASWICELSQAENRHENIHICFHASVPTSISLSNIWKALQAPNLADSTFATWYQTCLQYHWSYSCWNQQLHCYLETSSQLESQQGCRPLKSWSCSSGAGQKEGALVS